MFVHRIYSGKKQAVVVGVKDEKALNEIIALEQNKLGSLRDDIQKWNKEAVSSVIQFSRQTAG